MEMMDHGRISYNFRQICIQIERLTNRILEEQDGEETESENTEDVMAEL